MPASDCVDFASFWLQQREEKPAVGPESVALLNMRLRRRYDWYWIEGSTKHRGAGIGQALTSLIYTDLQVP